jgi:two-component system, LytTR family, response regulator
MKNNDLQAIPTVGEEPNVTMKAILVDDEKSSLRSLTYELNAYCPEVTVVAQCQDPVKAVEEIRINKPDIVFLDIEMPGMNGFELLQQFTEIDFDVIFVTAYDRFAMKAFDFNAVDYVLKPVRKSKLIQAVQKAAERQYHGIAPSDLQALLQNINVQAQTGIIQNIALPTSEGFAMVDINDICYLNSDSNYTWVYTVNQKKYLVSKTLKEFVGMLNFPQFFRAHKSYFVNLNHLDRYIRGNGGYLVLKNGAQIPVSRANKAELMRLLNI